MYYDITSVEVLIIHVLKVVNPSYWQNNGREREMRNKYAPKNFHHSLAKKKKKSLSPKTFS